MFTTLSKLKAEDPLLWYLNTTISRQDPPRTPCAVHASDVFKQDHSFCARERAISIKNNLSTKQKALSASQGYTFALGEAISEIIVNQFAKNNHAYGFWQCSNCKNLHFLGGQPKICPLCDSRVPHKYVECRFTSKATGIRSSIDMLTDLDADDNMLRVVENKSIEQSKFKTIKAPLAEHRLRTNFYLRNVQESDTTLSKHIHSDYGYIIYATKGFGTKGGLPTGTDWSASYSPFKVFKVNRDDSVTDQFLDQPIKFKYWAENKKEPLPKKEICNSIKDERAKECPAAKLCFQMHEQS